MNQYEYVIIGGGVAGVTAAETIRELDPAGSIAMVSDEPHPLYSRVLLPRYVKGEIGRHKLFLRSEADYAAKGIAFHAGERAVRLDAGRRMVTLAKGRELGFGKLLIASGGRPRRLGIPGEDQPAVTRFQTIEDADAIVERLRVARRAVVVGGGFIALEYLDILGRRSIPTALIFRDRHFFGRHLDRAGSELLHENFRRKGVGPILAGETVMAIRPSGKGVCLATDRGMTVSGDFVGFGVGLEKDVGWLAASGIGITPRGIETDEHLETATPGIFAAGDVADFSDPITGERQNRGNWSNSFLQGKVAGANMVAGRAKEAFQQASSYSIRSLDYVISFVGKTRLESGIQAVVRSDAAAGAYERFFLRQGRLVGAVLLNRPQDKAVVMALVTQRAEIRDAETRLGDMAVDLSTLAARG